MQSMEEVYKEHSKTVYCYLLSLSHNADLAEELVQETFYQAIKSTNHFDGTCKMSTWLCAIAKNQFYAYLRKHPNTEELDEAFLFEKSVEEEVISGISQVELFRKMHRMEETAREVIYLRLFGNLSFKEIGEVLGKSENTARVMYYRGKERLKKEMESDEK